MGRGIMGRGIVIGDLTEVLGSSQEALRRLPRGSPAAPQMLPEAPRRPPGGSQEAARATKAPRGS